MPTTQARKALATFWLWFAQDGDDSPGAFTVLPARLIYLALIVVVVISITAVLVAV